MPTYAYACTECDHRFEAVQSFSDDSLTVCPECEGRLRKVFNAVGIVFKGGGFYRTDSRSGSSVPSGSSSGSDSAQGSDSSGPAGSGTSSDSGSSGSGSSSGSGGSGSGSSAGSSSTGRAAPAAPSTTPA